MAIFLFGFASGLTVALAILIILARSPRLHRALNRVLDEERAKEKRRRTRPRFTAHASDQIFSADDYRRANGFEGRD